jgi:hypothetical protein
MPLTLEQVVMDTKRSLDNATDGMTREERRAFLWELETVMCGFPPAPVPQNAKTIYENK